MKRFEYVLSCFKLRSTWLICNYYLQPTWMIELWPKTTTMTTTTTTHTTYTSHCGHFQHPGRQTGGRAFETHLCLKPKMGSFFFWTNQCSIIYLDSNLQTKHQVGKREPAVTKNVPKQCQTCRLGLGTKVSLFFFFFLFWLIYKLQKMAMRKTGLSDTSGVVS